MESHDVVNELRILLRPYIGEASHKKDSVYEEDVEGVIRDAAAFQVADKFLARIKARPNASFWDLYGQMIEYDVPGDMLAPPGQEYILDNDEYE